MNTQTEHTDLDALTFDNRFTHELPADPETGNHRRQVRDACYSRVNPTPVANPKRVAYSKEVAEFLDLTQETCESERFTQVFAGNHILEDMDPFAMCYGGHQFGNWAGQLGDGRAINLGEVVNKKGEHWTLQLKGAGPTPYSRTADGLAVLRSSVREFLCSEAMYRLGVPTTRALSLVTTGEPVMRDMLYDGNPKNEPGAVVCRVAPSFTRFGNFQIFAAQQKTDLLKQLVDYTIRTDFPHLGEPSKEVYLAWFGEICRKTALMIAHWMRVGFVHGVMNTDNMSILSLTIDYGPYGWLEDFDPNWTPNTTDAQGRRYRYGHQPQIAHWNLAQLANAIFPLIDDTEALQAALDVYPNAYEQHHQTMMMDKLGLNTFNPDTDNDLITNLFEALRVVETDMTLFYRNLADVDAESQTEKTNDELIEPLLDAYYAPDELTSEHKTQISTWIRNYIQRVKQEGTSNDARKSKMNQSNPKYVLRNYLAQLAIDKAEEGDN
ncbi:MAG: YdiU family protein, partial [Candidatus Latescibacteria bacterium]|nr:YdiU family protein [Candidatus Latescibacterota bacterium]